MVRGKEKERVMGLIREKELIGMIEGEGVMMEGVMRMNGSGKRVVEGVKGERGVMGESGEELVVLVESDI